MKKTILLILPIVVLTGCLNPKLCGVKGTIYGKDMTSEHLQYFTEKPNLSVAEAHGTILPILHTREFLQKRSDGYRYRNHTSLLGGLLLDVDTAQSFDKEGIWNKEMPLSVSFNVLAGLLYEVDVDSEMNDLKGSTKKSFLLKAFGSSQEIGGSKYYTIFWMPMKFSDSSEGKEN